jgi:predicted nucleotidyltransferase
MKKRELSVSQFSVEGIKSTLKKHEHILNDKYRVKEIGIFGSYVKGKAKKSSDLDILVEFEKDADISLLEFIELENYLSDLLGVKVDLVMKDSLKPRIGKHILKEVAYL